MTLQRKGSISKYVSLPGKSTSSQSHRVSCAVALLVSALDGGDPKPSMAGAVALLEGEPGPAADARILLVQGMTVQDPLPFIAGAVALLEAAQRSDEAQGCGELRASGEG